MSHTDKTDPWWVRKERGHPDYIPYCGTGCPYCGLGSTRRRNRRIRTAVKRALRVGNWKREYTND
jgi:hypothetical protein